MQSYALTIDKFLEHAAKWSGDREVVSADAGQARSRIGYAALRERSNRLSGALQALGLAVGDRVGTLAWNTQHHFEMYYATMGAGLVCHTLNPRYSTDHLAAIINEAGDRALAVASNLTPLLSELVPRCPTLEHIVLMDGRPPHGFTTAGWPTTLWFLEALLDEHGAATVWGAFDETAPAGLCYTSGTTGAPKGVLYTHRSNYLHTLHALLPDAIALNGQDSVLAAVPMFHANGWGLPFAAPAVGAKLVLPGRHTDGASLAKLMRDERVSVAVGVHTLWLGVIDHLDAVGRRTAGSEAGAHRWLELPGHADPAHGGSAGSAGADELGHDRAVAIGDDRVAGRAAVRDARVGPSASGYRLEACRRQRHDTVRISAAWWDI